MQARASLEDIKEKLDAGEAALEDIKLLLINCSPKEFNDLLSGKAFQAAFKQSMENMAQAIIAHDAKLYLGCNLFEWLRMETDLAPVGSQTPTLLNYTDELNALSAYVEQDVLSTNDKPHSLDIAALQLHYWLVVAKNCLENIMAPDLMGVIAIQSAIKGVGIDRLIQRTKSANVPLLSDADESFLLDLNKLCMAEGNFINSRNFLKSHASALPNPGLYLTDITVVVQAAREYEKGDISKALNILDFERRARVSSIRLPATHPLDVEKYRIMPDATSSKSVKTQRQQQTDAKKDEFIRFVDVIAPRESQGRVSNIVSKFAKLTSGTEVSKVVRMVESEPERRGSILKITVDDLINPDNKTFKQDSKVVTEMCLGDVKSVNYGGDCFLARPSVAALAVMACHATQNEMFLLEQYDKIMNITDKKSRQASVLALDPVQKSQFIFTRNAINLASCIAGQLTAQDLYTIKIFMQDLQEKVGQPRFAEIDQFIKESKLNFITNNTIKYCEVVNSDREPPIAEQGQAKKGIRSSLSPRLPRDAAISGSSDSLKSKKTSSSLSISARLRSDSSTGSPKVMAEMQQLAAEKAIKDCLIIIAQSQLLLEVKQKKIDAFVNAEEVVKVIAASTAEARDEIYAVLIAANKDNHMLLNPETPAVIKKGASKRIPLSPTLFGSDDALPNKESAVQAASDIVRQNTQRLRDAALISTELRELMRDAKVTGQQIWEEYKLHGDDSKIFQEFKLLSAVATTRIQLKESDANSDVALHKAYECLMGKKNSFVNSYVKYRMELKAEEAVAAKVQTAHKNHGVH